MNGTIPQKVGEITLYKILLKCETCAYRRFVNGYICCMEKGIVEGDDKVLHPVIKLTLDEMLEGCEAFT